MRWSCSLPSPWTPSPAAARTLEVGPGHEYAQPSAASAVAQAGDTVSIAPGEYFDCAIWVADGLIIAGAPGGPVTITDMPCAGKAAFVIEGNGVTVRNLSFARIRVRRFETVILQSPVGAGCRTTCA